MSEKISLPSGGWAVLREPAAVSVKLRRPVEKALMAVGRGRAKAALNSDASEVAANLDPAVLDQFYELNDLLILARVESWSFEFDITKDSLLELAQPDYEELQKASAVDVASMIPNFGLSNDQASPIKPSGE